jgi:hypothetical protein
MLRRCALLLVFILLILASNIVMLTVDAVYDTAKRGLWNLASLITYVEPPNTHRRNRDTIARLTAHADDLELEAQKLSTEFRLAQNEVAKLTSLNESLESRVSLAEVEKAQLDQRLRRTQRELTDLDSASSKLDAERNRLSRRLVDLEIQVNELEGPLRKRVIAVNERLAQRTSRMISTNLSSMAIEAVPYFGTAAIVGVTYLEVRDACLSLADTREMSLLLSGAIDVEVPACGYSPAEFWDILGSRPINPLEAVRLA